MSIRPTNVGKKNNLFAEKGYQRCASKNSLVSSTVGQETLCLISCRSSLMHTFLYLFHSVRAIMLLLYSYLQMQQRKMSDVSQALVSLCLPSSSFFNCFPFAFCTLLTKVRHPVIYPLLATTSIIYGSHFLQYYVGVPIFVFISFHSIIILTSSVP